MELKEWFIEKDYGIGLVLFGQLSKNRVLLQNLIRKQNPAKLEYELKKIAAQKGIDLSFEEATSTNPNEDPVNPQSHSDQVIDQMNADILTKQKLEELKEGAVEVIDDMLGDMETDAENIVTDKLKEFEAAADAILSGKLKIIRDGKEVNYEQLTPVLRARWDQNRDGYKEIRSLHEKLKLMVNATDADRQPLTRRIADLDDIIRDNWVIIDSWIPEAVEAAGGIEAIDHKRIQSNRKYISTNLKKIAEISDPVKLAKVVTELQLRFDELKAAGESVTQETMNELAKVGVTC